ncbi:TetR family transcriptional regulator [Actinoplanes sp. L3-i22]|uniref:TetR family transcriptional regulator n=1 Tax=Actinoplanes sp. L3-i22 TaxID=2836373 RepID=UPI001C779B24|nr:TetR family transcriptional regulator [Actinoplanes sp. L3-i22]BCY12106.1 hypothetical protein L3i22_071940 [Actinoplanes sp. L3-i22]
MSEVGEQTPAGAAAAPEPIKQPAGGAVSGARARTERASLEPRERAQGGATPEVRERAQGGATPEVRERAQGGATPEVRERAQGGATPEVRERAQGGATPEVRERAQGGATPEVRERAQGGATPEVRERAGSVAAVGLREMKKQRTFDVVSEIAIAMFLERGFDRVSVNDVAAAAEISKPTLFRYFPSKEDLVLHRFADHAGEPARVVAGRGDGVSPVDALHRHFRDGLVARDPVTGLNDVPEILAFHDLVFSTPSLATRVHEYQVRDEESLAAALGPVLPDGLGARVAAAQVLAVQRVLARENWRRLNSGASADDLYPVAVDDADRAFAQLRSGIGVTIGRLGKT